MYAKEIENVPTMEDCTKRAAEEFWIAKEADNTIKLDTFIYNESTKKCGLCADVSGTPKDSTDGTKRYEVNEWKAAPIDKPQALKAFYTEHKQNMGNNDPLRWHSWFTDFVSTE